MSVASNLEDKIQRRLLEIRTLVPGSIGDMLKLSLIACDEETTDTTNAPNEQESTQSTQAQEPSDTDDGWEKPVTDVNALDYALSDDGSYYIVTGMGGTIELETELGKGSQFTVKLPTE